MSKNKYKIGDEFYSFSSKMCGTVEEITPEGYPKLRMDGHNGGLTFHSIVVRDDAIRPLTEAEKERYDKVRADFAERKKKEGY